MKHILIFLAILLKSTKSVEIYEAITPNILEFGSQEEVVLNCDYELSEAERPQLDLKWYFNGDVVPFLQWIPGENGFLFMNTLHFFLKKNST